VRGYGTLSTVQHLPLNEVMLLSLIITLFESYNLQVIGVVSVQVLSRQIVMLSGVLDDEVVSSNVEAKTIVKSKKRLKYEIAFIG